MSIFFISYQHDSKPFARELKSRMGDVGLVGWWDEDLKTGDEWKPTIDTMLRQCVGVIVVVTPKALASQYVIYEWSFGLGLGKRLVPILLEQPDSASIHPRLNDFQYRDFTESEERPWELLIGELQEIVSKEYIPPEIKEAEANLYKSDPTMRRNAIDFLSRHEDRHIVVEIFARAVQSKSPDVSIETGLALARITDYQDVRAIRGLKAAVADSRYESEALNTLSRMNNEAAIECLLECYHTTNRDTHQMDIVRALAKIKNRAIIPVLRTMLFEPRVAVEIVEALGEFRDPEVIPDLVKHFHRSDLVPDGKARALKALGRIGHPAAIEPLFEIFKTYANDIETTSNMICTQAFVAIGAIGGEEAIQALRNARNLNFQYGNQYRVAIDQLIQQAQEKMRDQYQR